MVEKLSPERKKTEIGEKKSRWEKKAEKKNIYTDRDQVN
jgi:hypothetical protein